MRAIADGARPRSAITKPPRGWLEPGNLKSLAPVGCKARLFALDVENNAMLFHKSEREDYELLKDVEDVMENLLLCLQRPGGAIVLDNGVSTVCVCRPGVRGKLFVVDPHCVERAMVTEIEFEGLRKLVQQGVMAMCFNRDV